jgi:3-isopropylmalate/(R)-2-methylmalate dehydratase small subunit
MEPFVKHTGLVAAMDRVNVDTDQIMPKQFLKRIERTGFGEFLFFDWRSLPDGSPNPDFELNAPAFQGASILVAGRNFGSGSSREHAPWGLLEYGFRVIIAPSLADIFRNNCLQNGVLPIVMDQGVVDRIMEKAQAKTGYRLTVDLETVELSDDTGLSEPFEIDKFRRYSLLNGLDDIGLTMQQEDKIAVYERSRWPARVSGD